MSAHRRSMAAASTCLVAAAHLILALLDQERRAAFQWPPVSDLDEDWQWLAVAGDWDGWTLMHLTVAVVLIVCVYRHRGRAAACRLSVGVMWAWSVLALWWACIVPVPVSLVGPSLGLIIAALAYTCSRTWTLEGKG